MNTDQELTPQDILAAFPSGESLSFSEICAALGPGDWTEVFTEASYGLITSLPGTEWDYWYRVGDDAAEANALTRTIGDLHARALDIKERLAQSREAQLRQRSAVLGPQCELIRLLDEIREMAAT